MATRAQNGNIFKSNLLSHMPIHHLIMCQDSGERFRALGPLVYILAKISSYSFQNGLLGIFQKLIASKTNDHEGFYLLNSIVEHMPA